jgi:hypothetical protein
LPFPHEVASGALPPGADCATVDVVGSTDVGPGDVGAIDVGPGDVGAGVVAGPVIEYSSSDGDGVRGPMTAVGPADAGSPPFVAVAHANDELGLPGSSSPPSRETGPYVGDGDAGL